MAAALFNALADPTKARAISAGTEPAGRIHPEVVDIMCEVGIDLFRVTPQCLTEDVIRGVQILVTMGCGEACPVLPGSRRIDWALPDPGGRPVDEVRRIRDDIRQRVVRLVDELGCKREAASLSAGGADS